MADPSKLSLQVQNQLKNGEVIQATALHFPAGARGTAAARMVTAENNADAALATVDRLVAGIHAAISGATTALHQAETAYTAEQADDPPIRKRRDTARGNVSARRSEVRDQIKSRFGHDALVEYGLNGEAAETPDALAKDVANTVALLRKNAREHTNGLGTFTTTAAADYLAEALVPLDEALTQLKRELKELQDAVGQRDTAATAWRDVYQGAATLLEGLLRLGGRPELAARVRPTERRTSGLDIAEPTVSTEPGAPAQPAGPGVAVLPAPA